MSLLRFSEHCHCHRRHSPLISNVVITVAAVTIVRPPRCCLLPSPMPPLSTLRLAERRQCRKSAISYYYEPTQFWWAARGGWWGQWRCLIRLVEHLEENGVQAQGNKLLNSSTIHGSANILWVCLGVSCAGLACASACAPTSSKFPLLTLVRWWGWQFHGELHLLLNLVQDAEH